MSIRVKCPTCKKESAYRTDNPFRPFCCERCRLIDLGTWLEEGYGVPVSGEMETGDNFDMPTSDGHDG